MKKRISQIAILHIALLTLGCSNADQRKNSLIADYDLFVRTLKPVIALSDNMQNTDQDPFKEYFIEQTKCFIENDEDGMKRYYNREKTIYSEAEKRVGQTDQQVLIDLFTAKKKEILSPENKAIIDEYKIIAKEQDMDLDEFLNTAYFDLLDLEVREMKLYDYFIMNVYKGKLITSDALDTAYESAQQEGNSTKYEELFQEYQERELDALKAFDEYLKDLSADE